MNTPSSKSDSSISRRAKLKSKRKRNLIPSALKHCVRDFWVRWLKPDLKLHPQICISETYRELAKLKDVSIKKLKNLVFTHVGSQAKFGMVQQIYREILEIFRRNPNIEIEYPKHTSLLRKWFDRVLRLSYEDVTKLVAPEADLAQRFEADDENSPVDNEGSVIPKIEDEVSPSVPPLNTNLVIPVPYEYLLVMQHQISHLISIISSLSSTR